MPAVSDYNQDALIYVRDILREFHITELGSEPHITYHLLRVNSANQVCKMLQNITSTTEKLIVLKQTTLDAITNGTFKRNQISAVGVLFKQALDNTAPNQRYLLLENHSMLHEYKNIEHEITTSLQSITFDDLIISKQIIADAREQYKLHKHIDTLYSLGASTTAVSAITGIQRTKITEDAFPMRLRSDGKDMKEHDRMIIDNNLSKLSYEKLKQIKTAEQKMELFEHLCSATDYKKSFRHYHTVIRRRYKESIKESLPNARVNELARIFHAY